MTIKTECLTLWKDFDYTKLKCVEVKNKKKHTYNNIIIMADTETSKSENNHKLQDGKWNKVQNYVVCWSIAILVNNTEYILYGRKPSELCDCIEQIVNTMTGEQTYIYFHNLSYDYQFLRKFFMRKFGLPVEQLNVKPLYPLYVEYGNGVVLKDSLLLAQRKLEKWADDLDVKHKKAVGCWDYDKIRTQKTELSKDELLYIQNDVLAGVECLQKMCENLGVAIGNLPYTNTGIVRREIKAAGKANGGNSLFKKLVTTKTLNDCLERAYHGGYTHANRDYIGCVEDDVECYDFSSSYPYVILSEKFPMSKFWKLDDKKGIMYILENQDKYAFLFKLVMKGVTLKHDEPMPSLSLSKCEKSVNAVCDNGRILECAYCELYITEQDLITIMEQYEVEFVACIDIWVSKKDYLPRWLRDKVFEFFEKKTQLKGGEDAIAYMISKGMLNSIYGLMCEHTCREEIEEDYETGEFKKSPGDYSAYKNSKTNVLLYQWGVWITAYAQRNLFWLGRCCEEWLYCDTDSVYGKNWDYEKLNEYNDMCRSKIKKSGYSAVKNELSGEWYELGVAEFDGRYSEFVALGAKRYCCRYDDNSGRNANKLKITVAGVPKSGVKCLMNDINNFQEGFVFRGSETGKKTHYYIYSSEIWIDENGNECGDCVDLVECDYLLDKVYTPENWKKITSKEVKINVYE